MARALHWENSPKLPVNIIVCLFASKLVFLSLYLKQFFIFEDFTFMSTRKKTKKTIIITTG